MQTIVSGSASKICIMKNKKVLRVIIHFLIILLGFDVLFSFNSNISFKLIKGLKSYLCSYMPI